MSLNPKNKRGISCARCEGELEISEAAKKLIIKLGDKARPITCAKCAVDGGSGNHSGG
jgi:hypothetical protein